MIRTQIIHKFKIGSKHHLKEVDGMEYKEQIKKLCIQTYFNLYGVMPTPSELAEMLGDEDAPQQAA